jgi:hypothetical protein
MNSNKQHSTSYFLVGSLTALGGVAVGVTGSWIYNKFSKKRNDITYKVTHHKHYMDNLQTELQDKLPDRTDGVYIQNEDDSEVIFMTNNEFQKYFEDNVNSNNEMELEKCLLEYALKLDPMNLRFFKDSQKTLDYEKRAVETNINSIIYCRSTEETFCVKTQSDICSDEFTYKSYYIHDYAFDLYGFEIYKYIDHPEGYSYEELMSMPPSEFKDMTVSEVFNQFQNEKKSTDSPILNLKDLVKDQIPEILNIEFTNELTSSEEEDD